MIQICEDDVEELAEGLDSLLHEGGRLMGCIERMREGESSNYGRRYGRRMYGRRNENDVDGNGNGTADTDGMYGNRRGRDAYGRYM